MTNENEIVRRTVIRCRPNHTDNWREYVFPDGQSAATFWHRFLDAHPGGQAKIKYFIDAHSQNAEADNSIWREPQHVPAAPSSTSARAAAEEIDKLLASRLRPDVYVNFAPANQEIAAIIERHCFSAPLDSQDGQ